MRKAKSTKVYFHHEEKQKNLIRFNDQSISDEIQFNSICIKIGMKLFLFVSALIWRLNNLPLCLSCFIKRKHLIFLCWTTIFQSARSVSDRIPSFQTEMNMSSLRKISRRFFQKQSRMITKSRTLFPLLDNLETSNYKGYVKFCR